MYASLAEKLSDPVNLIIFLMGLIGIVLTIALNLFIIIAVIVDKSLRNFTNIQFASMSCADLLVGSIAMPCMLISTLFEYWPLSENLCIVFILGDFIGGNISIITLTIISHHRLKCIREPYGCTRKFSTLEMLLPAMFVWPIIIAFWTIPTIYIVKNQRYRALYYNLRYCYFIFSFEYVLVVDLIAYIIPMCLLIYFQASIYFALKSKRNIIKPLQQKNRMYSKLILRNNGNNGTSMADQQRSMSNQLPSMTQNLDLLTDEVNSVVVGADQQPVQLFQMVTRPPLNKRKSSESTILTRSPSQHQIASGMLDHQETNRERFIKSLRVRLFKTQLNLINHQMMLTNNYTKNKKVFRTLFFVTCYLITFWLPWIISWPIDAYCKCVPIKVYIITYWMEYSNSLINSVILIVANHHFRRKLLSIFNR